ncbi:MAG: hypothetical protein WC788_02425 [Candidatus Paceibacterota bacterium]|jgi:hypothetical protein
MDSTENAATPPIVPKNILIIVLMVLVVAVAIGLGLRQKEGGTTEEPVVERSDIKPIPEQERIIVPKIIYNLSGKITKIDGNTIVFNAEMYNVDEEGVRTVREEERKAIVNPQTKVSSLTFVNRTPVEKNIRLSDLKPGDYIEAISSSDISKADDFLAAKIVVKSSL